MTTKFRTIFGVVIFALLAVVTAPVHAAYVTNLDADLNLNFGSSNQLAGSISLEWLPVYYGGTACCRVNDYIDTFENLTLNGLPLTKTTIGQNANPYGGTTIDILLLTGIKNINFEVLGINTNYLPPNVAFSNFVLNGMQATSGTVNINSETLATPLPSTFPLLASALAAIGSVGWWKRRRVPA